MHWKEACSDQHEAKKSPMTNENVADRQSITTHIRTKYHYVHVAKDKLFLHNKNYFRDGGEGGRWGNKRRGLPPCFCVDKLLQISPGRNRHTIIIMTQFNLIFTSFRYCSSTTGFYTPSPSRWVMIQLCGKVQRSRNFPKPRCVLPSLQNSTNHARLQKNIQTYPHCEARSKGGDLTV